MTDQAFEELYRSTRVAVLGYLLRRCKDPADAPDLLSETYLVAWRRFGQVPPGDHARLWLYAVARRLLANDRRKRVSADAAAERLRSQLLVGLQGDVAEVDPQVTAALEALAPADREVLELSAYEGLTPQEIAEVLHLAPGTARVRLHRARERFKHSLALAGSRQA